MYRCIAFALYVCRQNYHQSLETQPSLRNYKLFANMRQCGTTSTQNEKLAFPVIPKTFKLSNDERKNDTLHTIDQIISRHSRFYELCFSGHVRFCATELCSAFS